MSACLAPEITLRSAPVGNLTPLEVRSCLRLTIEMSENMRGRLRDCLDEASGFTGRVVLAEEDGAIRGWALLWRAPGQQNETVYFFVDRAHRRRGIGTAIANEVQRIRADARVCPWDDRSRSFFRNLTFEPAHGYAL